ncbi:hypothetical protein [Rathayibacter sp. VKM Ac-2630]|jgi:hypothetical protein|uniref:hypothetical protein n=1 Tax=Rathayibacter sp. VKM Ac-2630 TaxID=1938617 RepID=UPI0013019656|nr:hypothetical protein [Rathayibacter sp. VKM Ac-2630]
MNRTKMITALAAGLLLTSGVAAQPAAASESSNTSEDRGVDNPDTLLINGRAYTLD